MQLNQARCQLERLANTFQFAMEHSSTVFMVFTRSNWQTVLSAEAEQRLAETVITLAEWKVPVDLLDLHLLVKDYRDRQGVSDKRFRNNCPAPDWVKGFTKRHNLTKRIADNVKPARAEISAEDVTKYFEELQTALNSVPPQNLINYDETNVSDDPGAKHVLCVRGSKRVERKIYHSKTAISLMFSICADGTLLAQWSYIRHNRVTLNGALEDLLELSMMQLLPAGSIPGVSIDGRGI